MQINKKKALAVTGVFTIAALAGVIGTISYFTDKADIKNEFTVGTVDINIYESQLHRQNSGRQGSFGPLSSDPTYCDWNPNPQDQDLDSNTGLIKGSYEKARYCTPLMNANEGDSSTITAIANGHTRTGFPNANRTWGYMDSTIESDAADYKKSIAAGDNKDGYFTKVSQNIVPGQWVRKFTYAKNASNSSDAYILFRYMVPTSYSDNVEVKVPGTPYEEDVHADIEGIQGYFTALLKNDQGKYVAYPGNAPDAMDNYEGYVETIDGVQYRVYAAVTTDVVNPGEMTFWSPVNTVRLKTDVQNTDSTAERYVAPGEQIDVKVDAQAIQAKTFSNAVEAINNLQ